MHVMQNAKNENKIKQTSKEKWGTQIRCPQIGWKFCQDKNKISFYTTQKNIEPLHSTFTRIDSIFHLDSKIAWGLHSDISMFKLNALIAPIKIKGWHLPISNKFGTPKDSEKELNNCYQSNNTLLF